MIIDKAHVCYAIIDDGASVLYAHSWGLTEPVFNMPIH